MSLPGMLVVSCVLPAIRVRNSRRWMIPIHLAAQVAVAAAGIVAASGRPALLAVAVREQLLWFAVLLATCYAASVATALSDLTWSYAPLWARSCGYVVVGSVSVAALMLSAVCVLQVTTIDDVFVAGRPAAPTRASPPPSQEQPVDSTRTERAADRQDVPDASAVTPGTEQVSGEPVSRFNLLLIGSDAGEGRYGARADALNVVSVAADLSDVAVIAVPRNLRYALVPVGFESVLPERFDDLINAAHTWATARTEHQAVVERVLGVTEEPGWAFTAALVAETTGLTIDAWVAVDMAGFIEVIDAFGGLDVFVASATPAPGNVPSAKHPLPDVFEAGWQRMDGTDALGYVRSRSADSDYRRMGRQRCLLASLAAQNSAVDIAASWVSISNVLRAHVRTNVAPDKMSDLIDMLSFPAERTRVLALTPPTVPKEYDPYDVRRLVAAFLEASPAGSTAAVVDPAAGSPYSSDSTASTVPTAPTDQLGDTCVLTR